MTIHDFIKKQIAFFFRTKIKKTNALIFSIGIGNFNKTSSTMPAKNINVFLEKYYNIIEKVAVKYGGFVSLDMLSEILVTFPKENIKNNSEMVSGIVKEIFTHFKDLINKERDNSILSINIGVDLGIVIVTNKISPLGTLGNSVNMARKIKGLCKTDSVMALVSERIYNNETNKIKFDYFGDFFVDFDDKKSKVYRLIVD